tara:strand:- start:107 stop:382 length:276 start_codon:yes stop_codon:yes gene_type:complete
MKYASVATLSLAVDETDPEIIDAYQRVTRDMISSSGVRHVSARRNLNCDQLYLNLNNTEADYEQCDPDEPEHTHWLIIGDTEPHKVPQDGN